MTIKQRADLTFKYNLNQNRHSWLRLTPAYSIKVVQQLLSKHTHVTNILDPFCGTGTTGLVCAEQGLSCDLIDINPFLVWLARAKTNTYQSEQLQNCQTMAETIFYQAQKMKMVDDIWTPPIHNITRWWSENRLLSLAKIFYLLHQISSETSPSKDLLLIAFCNLVIHWSNAAFNHQSMSFKDSPQGSFFQDEEQLILDHFIDIVKRITTAAAKPLSGQVAVTQADSRYLPEPTNAYDCVITSPPYPNRMSYIRELRPYMYWLGYLKTGREAGELDWQAIGGTWGIATSRLNHWQAKLNQTIPHPDFETILTQISQHSHPLANYVHKYFVDIALHLQNISSTLTLEAKVFYIVGNSRFYDTLVPVERIYASLFEAYGFSSVKITTIRKRNSKKELFEYIVSAIKTCDTP